MEDSYYEGFRPDPRSTNELIDAALNAGGCEAYSWILQLLQYRGNDEVFREALRMGLSAEEKERILGADILGQIGTPGRFRPDESVGVLLSLLSDESAAVVRSAAVSLGFHQAPEAIERLVELGPARTARFGLCAIARALLR